MREPSVPLRHLRYACFAPGGLNFAILFPDSHGPFPWLVLLNPSAAAIIELLGFLFKYTVVVLSCHGGVIKGDDSLYLVISKRTVAGHGYIRWKIIFVTLACNRVVFFSSLLSSGHYCDHFVGDILFVAS